MYAFGDPVNLSDPNGHRSAPGDDDNEDTGKGFSNGHGNTIGGDPAYGPTYVGGTYLGFSEDYGVTSGVLTGAYMEAQRARKRARGDLAPGSYGLTQDIISGTIPPGYISIGFSTPLAAAFAAIDLAQPYSNFTNLEYGGLLYGEVNKPTFGFTGPIQGTPTGLNLSAAPAPLGATVVGDYHTHGNYSAPSTANPGSASRVQGFAQDRYNSDQFSPTDLQGIAIDAARSLTPQGYTGYLGTPGGLTLSFTPFHPNANLRGPRRLR